MDIKKLLASLNAHKVRYVIIGATAFPVHGFDRATQDIDIFIEPTPENGARAMEAIEAVGYDFMGLSLEQFLAKKTLFRQYVLDTDIHPFVAGVTFAEIWKHRIRGVCEGVTAHFPCLDHVIAMKYAAGRPKDLEDLRYLEKIREIKAEKKRKRAKRR